MRTSRHLLRPNRQYNGHFKASGLNIFRADRSAMHTNRLHGDSEAQAVPASRVPVCVDSKERLENLFKSVFRHPRTMVTDGKYCSRFGSTPIDRQTHLDVCSRLCKTHRVANNIFTGAGSHCNATQSASKTTGPLPFHWRTALREVTPMEIGDFLTPAGF